jgi:hypothetical protein
VDDRAAASLHPLRLQHHHRRAPPRRLHALLDFGYRAEVVGALPAFEKTDCPFDLGFAFPDEWYQLKNPRASDPPADRPMPFTLPRLFFRPQYASAPAGGGPALELIHVALIVVGNFTSLSDAQREVLRTSIEITKDGLTLSTAAVSAPGSPAWRFAKTAVPPLARPHHPGQPWPSSRKG